MKMDRMKKIAQEIWNRDDGPPSSWYNPPKIKSFAESYKRDIVYHGVVMSRNGGKIQQKPGTLDPGSFAEAYNKDVERMSEDDKVAMLFSRRGEPRDRPSKRARELYAYVMRDRSRDNQCPYCDMKKCGCGANT